MPEPARKRSTVGGSPASPKKNSQSPVQIANPKGANAHQGAQVPIESQDSQGLVDQVGQFADWLSDSIDETKKAVALNPEAFGLNEEEMNEFKEVAGTATADLGVLSGPANIDKVRRGSVATKAEAASKLVMTPVNLGSDSTQEHNQEAIDALQKDDTLGPLLEHMGAAAERAGDTLEEAGTDALNDAANALQSVSTDMLKASDGPFSQAWEDAANQAAKETASEASSMAESLWDYASVAATYIQDGASTVGEYAEGANEALEAVGLDLPGAVSSGARVATGLVSAGYQERYRLELFELEGKTKDPGSKKAIKALLDRTKVLDNLGKSGKGMAEGAGKMSGVPMGGTLASMAADQAGSTMMGPAEDLGPFPPGLMTEALTTWTDASVAARLYRVAEAMDYEGDLKVLGELKSASNGLEGSRLEEFNDAMGQHGKW